MKKYLRLLSFLVAIAATFNIGGCSSVQPYEKMYLNDIDMKLANQQIESFEINFQTYREGASGADGGKVGGGCGCN